MEYVVLGLLMIQSLTLYQLNQAFKQGISMFYSASYGSLQAAIKQLLAKELIGFEEYTEHGRNKKVYSINAQGRQAFYDWMMSEVPANKLEVTALSKVYFLGLIAEDAHKKQILSDIVAKIEAAQADLDGLHQQLSRMEVPAAYAQIFTYQLKALDYGRQAHVFGKAWFQGLLDALEAGSIHTA